MAVTDHGTGFILFGDLLGLSSRKLSTTFSCARDLGKPEQGQRGKEDVLHDRVSYFWYPLLHPAHHCEHCRHHLYHSGVSLYTLLSQEGSPSTLAQGK